MAYLALTLSSVILFTFSDVAGQETGNFPLSECHTGQFDILVLETTSPPYKTFHKPLPTIVTEVWQKSETKDSRVLISKVKDISAEFTNKCAITLVRSNNEVMDLCSTFPDAHSNSSSLHQEIKVKIKMASIIFSDMEVGRQNSSHIAVVTLDSLKYKIVTTEEIRRIPDILQEANSKIKVFIILHDFGTEVEPIFLRDTIIAGRYVTNQHVSMAMCKQCLPGWFQLEYTRMKHFMSCYTLNVSPDNVDWFESSKTCSDAGGNLVTVESMEELDFLQTHIFLQILLLRQVDYDFRDFAQSSIELYIGLKRDLESVTKRFQWALKYPNRYRPLVINHWLPGKPSGGFIHACGSWFYNIIVNYTILNDLDLGNASAVRSKFLDYLSNGGMEGWASVGCGTKLSRGSLCEMTLAQHLTANDVIIANPANKNSFDKVISKSDFRDYEGNIVAVSAYVNNEAFLKFMEDRKEHFPMFDCGENTEAPRYISYSYVSDGTKHCRNGHDETLHEHAMFCFSMCGCISVHSMCNYIKDCEDGRDEVGCEENNPKRCCDGTFLPLHLFNDGEVDCSYCEITDDSGIHDELSDPKDYYYYDQIDEACVFTCNSNECIYAFQLNDSKVDCKGADGRLDETIGKLEGASTCSDGLGRPKWAPRCVYLNDRYGSVLGCRDLSHLQECSNFPCQEGYYKCPYSYCIPLHYVMDGKEDCPSGEEEGHIVKYTCAGNFLCWNSSVCLHPDLVCDGASHCPHKDDELNCDVQCMDGFRCVADTVTADTNKALIRLEDISFMVGNTRYLDVSGVDVSNVTFPETKCVDVFDVRLSGCKLLSFNDRLKEAFCDLYETISLDLSHNLISSVTHDSVITGPIWKLLFLRELNLSFNKQLREFINVDMVSLEKLDLSHTGLSYTDRIQFHSFPKLKSLNLRSTRISTFYRDIFPSGFTLQTLDLRGSPIEVFFENTYNGLIITSSIYTDKYGMCCPQVRGSGVPEYMCHASEDPVASCFDLISLDVHRILLWLMAATAILGNLIVIAYLLIWHRQTLLNANGLFVLNLGISDFLMGQYLFMIAVADVYYRGVYVLYDRAWRESVICNISGFLANVSCLTSIFFIFLITVNIYLTHISPCGYKHFSSINKIAATSLSWVVGIMLSITAVLPILRNSPCLTPTPMCNYILITSEQQSGWKYLLASFIALKSVILLVTAFVQILIFRSNSENEIFKESKKRNSLSRLEDTTVGKYVPLVVLSNLISWIIVSRMGFSSFSGYELNNDMYAWTVVLVFPVNSAINPVVYIILLLMIKWRRFKYGDSTPK